MFSCFNQSNKDVDGIFFLFWYYLFGSICFSPFFQIRKKCLFFASWWWRSYLLLWFSYFHHDFYISLRKDATWQIVFRSAVFPLRCLIFPYMRFSLFWIYILLHHKPCNFLFIINLLRNFHPNFFSFAIKVFIFWKNRCSLVHFSLMICSSFTIHEFQ